MLNELGGHRRFFQSRRLFQPISQVFLCCDEDAQSASEQTASEQTASEQTASEQTAKTLVVRSSISGT
ncbi:hypothetical protein CKO42_15835 [Lamprobacter modestohalophilus]|uniref:Uncharacterized protein n=1 Tax=Lamprobacter modestohalophilus TaxID=1064514 RepID=A0A9X0WA59_9GAMM|nr:hypothetical protein [Lamprobacter modestohalophilus]